MQKHPHIPAPLQTGHPARENGAGLNERRRLAAFAALFLSISPVYAQEPRTSFRGNTPISVSDLVDRMECFPAQVTGRVVKRAFDGAGTMLQSVTVEQRSGERIFINVDGDRLNKTNMADRANAIRALQIILREGARVSLGTYACGAAGRVLMLNSARSM